MPKNVYTPRRLTTDSPPDCCELCPLIGKIPDDERRTGERKGYYCLGIFEAETDEDGKPVLDQNGVQQLTFPRLTSKGIRTSASRSREGGHLLHRPCDAIWDAWMTLPGRLFAMPTDTYIKYRLPYEREQQVKNYPKFKFKK